MSLVQLLEQEEEEIIAIASDSLARARLRRYEEAGRDTLARTYVSLASQTKAPSLNLAALFDGTDSIDMS